MKVPNEVSKIAFSMFHSPINHNHLQYIQIAEIVLSKLPSTMQLPETNHELRETRISPTTEKTNHDGTEVEHRNDNSNNIKALETDSDMVWILNETFKARKWELKFFN